MLAPVTSDQFLDRTCERECFVKRRNLARFHDHGCDASRSRFFAQLTKETGQLLLAVIVYDCRRGEARPWVHSHVERTVSNQTEPALRIFQLPGRNPQIKKGASDAANPKLIKDTVCVSEICLPHDDAPAKMRQTLGHVLDRIRVLVQRQNIGATFQKRFGVASATTCSVENYQACFRVELFKDFPL